MAAMSHPAVQAASHASRNGRTITGQGILKGMKAFKDEQAMHNCSPAQELGTHEYVGQTYGPA